jgi:antitoxin (DNA-binding transcriptional repressor) of toxin-antitoxin stability system
MKTVGVRELKNRLSEYVRQAKSGEGVLVTDRGQVVAELAPPGHGATDAAIPSGLLALARRNLLVIGAPAEKALYPALPRTRRRRRAAADLLRDERGDR